MQYKEANVLCRVYSEPRYLTVFKQIINGYGPQSHLSLVVNSATLLSNYEIEVVNSLLNHICSTRCHTMAMAHSSGVCRYVFPFSTPMNPQDADADIFMRDEIQGQGAAHAHALIDNVDI